MKRTDWIVLTLALSTALLSLNIVVQSPVIGIIASIIFIGGASAILGRWFFTSENKAFRFALGMLTLLMLLSLTGAAFVIMGSFTEPVSLFTFLALYVALTIMLRRLEEKGSAEVDSSSDAELSTKDTKNTFRSFVSLLPFASFVTVAFMLLWLARTGEGVASVWLTIPSIFGAMYLISGFSLFVVVFSNRLGNNVKLASICFFSLLSHSLFLLVWYPGRYGDPWSHLGEVRYIVRTGMPYAHSWMLQESLWVDLLKFRGFHSLVAFLERMLYFDLYWIYILLVPVLWSVFTPLLAYKTAATLAIKKSKMFPYLAALATLAFPTLIAWGAVSVPNSLGFVFFFASALLALMWIRQGDKKTWLLAALAALASSFAHPQAGIFAVMFLFLATVIQKTKRKVVWVLCLLVLFAVYPTALRFQDATFASVGLYQINNFLNFQSEISTLLLIFGLVGLILGIRGKYVDSKTTLLLFCYYVIILFEYYFTKYGMANLPYGPVRILAMADLLLAPLVALGFWALITSMKRTIRQTTVPPQAFMKLLNVKSRSRFSSLILIGLFLSFQFTAVLYQAYPQNELVKVQPSVYELEAIRYIDSNAPTRYVVLCEPGFASLAIGFLGTDYGYLGGGKGLFGYPEWGYPTVQMYLEMTKNPSIGILKEAMNFTNAEMSFFVISERNPDFDKIVARSLDIFPAYQAFGDDKLYVFWYPLPVFEEDGPSVRVVFDDGLGGEQNVTTKLSYMIESEINSTLTLIGYTSYRVTSFPTHWTFLDLRINSLSSEFDGTSDVNSFIYVRGLQTSDVVTLKWLFNRRYTNVGWKEDSFKGRVWSQGPYYSNITPIITTDGNVLSISFSLTPDSYQYYYHSTSVDLSTTDYPYLLMRWRADQPVAVSAIYFDAGGSYEIIQFGSMSTEWSSIIVTLPPNAFVRTIMVGFNNARNQRLSGPVQMEIDYI